MKVRKFIRVASASKDFAEGRLKVNTCMSDNIDCVNNMSKKLFATPSNVCFNHSTGNALSLDYYRYTIADHIAFSGIQAAGYKHIQYFDGNRKAYDIFFDIQVDIGHFGDKLADWEEEYWTSDRRRICMSCQVFRIQQ